MKRIRVDGTSPSTMRRVARVGSGALLVGASPALMIAANVGVADATTFTVNNCNDTGAGSLRNAIDAASDGDTIDFSGIGCATIDLTSGQLSWDTASTITGPGASNMSISGLDASRVFDVSGSGLHTISGVTIAHGLAGDGGGLRLATGSLMVSDVVFNSNVALESAAPPGAALGRGGAIFAQNTGDLTLTGSTVDSNHGQFGGGVVIDSPTAVVSISSSDFLYNVSSNTVASAGGGAVYVPHADSLTITGTSDFSHNESASIGGAIHSQVRTAISGATFDHNASAFAGGAVEISTSTGGASSITASTFTHNTTGDLQSNIDSVGGAIRFKGTDLSGGGSITNSTFTYNAASRSGGAIALDRAGTFSITGSTISSNDADLLSGGGVYVTSQGADPALATSVSSTTISGNHAGPQGGGRGGGLAFYRAGNVTFTDSTITGNTATSEGGGISIAHGKGYGGFTFDGGSVSNNSADRDGGGIFAYYMDGVSFDGTRLATNASLQDGGALAMSNSFYAYYTTYSTQGHVTISNATFEDNTAGPGSRGGALELMDIGGAVSIDGSMFDSNSAGDRSLYGDGSAGGAIHVFGTDDAPLTITSSEFIDNVATQWGGAIDFDSGSEQATVVGTTFAGNQASGANTTRRGGAISVRFIPFEMCDSTITGSSGTQGGGAYVNTSQQPVRFLFDTITGNQSSGVGSGVYVFGGSMTIDGSIVAGNTGTDDIEAHAQFSQSYTVDLTDSVIGTVAANVGANETRVVHSTAPGLGVLADNGGPTRTMAVLSGSPALGIGPVTWSPSFAGDSFDQRGTGFARIVSGATDAGAFQNQVPPTPTTTTSSSTTSTSTTSTTSTSTTTTTTPTPTTSTTIDVGPNGPATPTDGVPLDLTPGTAMMINADGTLTALTIAQTGPTSIGFGTPSLGVDLTGSSVTDGIDLGLTAGGGGVGSGFGFQPGSTASVWIMSTPQFLGSAPVDANGEFMTPFIVPADLVDGEHTVQLQGIGFDGEPRALAAGVTVSGGSALPATGRDLSIPVAIGSSLLVAGGLGVMASRRARRRAAGRVI